MRILISGPTSFEPIIEMAMTIVEQSGGQYHVLVIITDGQVFLIIFLSYESNFRVQNWIFDFLVEVIMIFLRRAKNK